MAQLPPNIAPQGWFYDGRLSAKIVRDDFGLSQLQGVVTFLSHERELAESLLTREEFDLADIGCVSTAGKVVALSCERTPYPHGHYSVSVESCGRITRKLVDATPSS